MRLEVVAGGGIFPTGTAIDLTPENKGLLDGQGAIEFRSYFAGANRLRATAAGLVPAELTIEAVGGEPWAGQHRNLPGGPPSRARRPAASDGRLLSELRPVFSSGYRAGHPPYLVTDHSTADGWRSAGHEPGAWLWIDLEGLWSLDSIQLEFGPGPVAPYLIELSDGGQDLHLLATGIADESGATFEVAGRHAHAVRLTFPEAPAEVRNIRIHGQ